MEPCDRWQDALLDHADGFEAPPEALAHFGACAACARELTLQRNAVRALNAPSEAFRLASPFRPPVVPRRRDRVVFGAAGAGVLGTFLALHGLVDPEPWTAIAAALGVLTPFSRTLFHHAGWGAVFAAGAALAAAGWGLKRLLQRA